MTTIEHRLAQVERQLRLQRSVILFLLIVLAAFVGIAATKPVPDVVRAKRFEAVNNDGRPAAVMAAFRGHGDGVFRAYNMNGVEVFYAGSSSSGAGKIEIKTPQGKIKTEMTGN